MLVAIDGTAASGKSSTAARVAEATGFVLMDSGLMYRAVAWACIKHGTEALEPALSDLLQSIRMEIGHHGSQMRVSINGEDITDHLRTTELSDLASLVAQSASVRRFTLSLQRGLGDRYGPAPGLVAEGRDMGTVVFPEADLKFFFTASVEVRARRRLKQLRELGMSASLKDLQTSLRRRDRADIQRNLAPLRRHPDAIDVDTDRITLDDQVAMVLERVRECSRRQPQS